MKWRRLTRLEGMLLGALVELTARTPTRAADDRTGDRPLCCRGFNITQEQCGHCGPLLRGHGLVEKVLAMQRSRKPRPTRKPAPRGSGRRREPELNRNVNDHKFDEPINGGRGGKRVGERRQERRTVHVINKESSARDVALAKNDLLGFFEDVLDKHHGGGF